MKNKLESITVALTGISNICKIIIKVEITAIPTAHNRGIYFLEMVYSMR